eukprot:SAG22_NODE_4542_length_1239_cov_2.242105_2_plen_307_part_01
MQGRRQGQANAFALTTQASPCEEDLWTRGAYAPELSGRPENPLQYPYNMLVRLWPACPSQPAPPSFWFLRGWRADADTPCAQIAMWLRAGPPDPGDGRQLAQLQRICQEGHQLRPHGLGIHILADVLLVHWAQPGLQHHQAAQADKKPMGAGRPGLHRGALVLLLRGFACAPEGHIFPRCACVPPRLQVLLAMVAVATLAYAIAFRVGSAWQLVRLLLSAMLVDFIGLGVMAATAGWFVANKWLRVPPRAHNIEQAVEWLYAFDVHCNSYFPLFLLLYPGQVCVCVCVCACSLRRNTSAGFSHGGPC